MAPRCRDCKTNFVEQPEQVCEECSPSICEYCKESTYQLHELRFNSGDLKYVCTSCSATICKNCENKGTLDISGICDPCNLEGDWIGVYPDITCRECGSNARVVNSEYICEKCYRETRREKHFRCAECNNLYVPNHELQFLCLSCLPACLGCGHKFNPLTKEDSLCPTCTIKAGGVGSCSRCGTTSQLSGLALCDDCESRHIPTPTYCNECLINKVRMTHICSPCSKKTKLCPRCMTNDMKVTFYVCKECQKDQEEKLFR